jgi:hypothetical protein
MIILLTPSHKPKGASKSILKKKKKTLTQTRHLDKKIKLTLILSVRKQILQHYIHQQKRKPTKEALGPPPCHCWLLYTLQAEAYRLGSN